MKNKKNVVRYSQRIMSIFPAQSLVTNIMNFHAGINIRPGMECIYQLFGLNKSHQVSLWNVSFFNHTCMQRGASCKCGSVWKVKWLKEHLYRFGSFEFQIILIMAWQQRRQANISTNEGLIDQRIYASLGFNELNRGSLWQADRVTLSHSIAMG